MDPTVPQMALKALDEAIKTILIFSSVRFRERLCRNRTIDDGAKTELARAISHNHQRFCVCPSSGQQCAG